MSLTTSWCSKMDSKLFNLKMGCLFHDPTIKPLVWKVHKRHEDVAERVIEELNNKLVNVKIDVKNKNIKKYIEHADWIAASSDRFIITELYNNILDEIYSVNILDMHVKKLDDLIINSLQPTWLDKYEERFISNLFDAINISNISKLNNKLHILYHIVWRFLIDATVRSLNNIKDVALLPADTRVPYYTIFDHLYTASGFITTLKEDDEVGRIGIIHWEFVGLQKFIQESRAFRDLWASSFLISLMNTAIIIKLAKEYGFDSILAPNMLYNPLVDLYLYIHTDDSRLKLRFEELKVSITPDKGFAIVPYSKVGDYINSIVKWFEGVWKSIAEEVKCYVENKFKDRINGDIYLNLLKKWIGINDESELERVISATTTDTLNWGKIWEICGYSIPINCICVGESITLDNIEDKIKEWKEILGYDYEEIFEERRKLREIATNIYPYTKNFQLLEFPIIIEVLKKRRKMIAESPRADVPTWVLDGRIYVKDRRLICNVCYKRPAIIFPIEDVIEVLNIKDDERLCPICLTKRLCADTDLFITLLSRIYEFADDTLSFDDIRRKIKEGVVINNVERSKPLAIPSLATISTLTFRNSMIALLRDWSQRYLTELGNIIEKSPLFINQPDIRWFNNDIINKNKSNELLYIGGECFIPEELKSYTKTSTSIRSIHSKIREISKELSKVKLDKIDNRIISTVVTNPGRYVALIKADGDNMGKLLTLTDIFQKKIEDVLPEKLNHYLKCNNDPIGNSLTVGEIKKFSYNVTPSFYTFVSRTLSIITRTIAKIASEHATTIIYAGGDDILALSPVEFSLVFAHKARSLFSQSFLDYDNIVITGLGKTATQSFAIRYFHIFTPLNNELKELNKDMEDIAKNINVDKKEKNGLVITYSARGGNDIRAILSWDSDIATKIFNILSLTLRYKLLVDNSFNIKKIINDESSLSVRALRDIINIASRSFNPEVINTVTKREIKRHSRNNIEDVVCDMPYDKKICLLQSGKQFIMSIEIIKAALALHNALDSKPLRIGVKL